MSDNSWLRELAQANQEKEAEERNRLGEHWDRLSSGDLSPEEEKKLRALAETSDEAREAYEAFRPLGPDFHASVVGAIQAQGLAPEAEVAPPKPPAKLLSFPRRAILLSSAVAATAAAAVLGLVLRLPAPLPDYSPPEISGGVRTMRGEQPAVPVFAPGDPIQVVLRPQTAASSAKRCKAQSFLSQGLDLRPLEVRSPQIDAQGAARMEGSIGRDIQPGPWTLWGVVSCRGKLPDSIDLRSSSEKVRGRNWVAVPAQIRIQSRNRQP